MKWILGLFVGFLAGWFLLRPRPRYAMRAPLDIAKSAGAEWVGNDYYPDGSMTTTWRVRCDGGGKA